MIRETRKIKSMTDAQFYPATLVIRKEEIQRKLEGIANTKTNTLEENILLMEKGFEELLKMKAKWEDYEDKIKTLDEEIADLKKIDHKENEMNCEGLLGYGNNK